VKAEHYIKEGKITSYHTPLLRTPFAIECTQPLITCTAQPNPTTASHYLRQRLYAVLRLQGSYSGRGQLRSAIAIAAASSIHPALVLLDVVVRRQRFELGNALRDLVM